MSRALLCGFGWAARSLWYPALRAAGFDRFGIVDQFATPTDSVAIDRVHADVSEIGPGDYDVAVVASPNFTHTDIAVTTLERGIPTVVEKPVCLRQRDVERLRSASVRGQAPLVRSRSTHYEPHLVAFVDHVREVLPAPPDRVSARWTRAQGVPRSRWLTQARHAGAGSSVDLGWHLLESLLDLVSFAPLQLVDADFTGLGGDGTVGLARWHGVGAEVAEIDVDVSADLRFRQAERQLTVRTAWQSSEPGDVVMLEAATGLTSTRLVTLLGVSDAEQSPPFIETTVEGRVTRSPLPARQRGAAHARMVAAYTAAGFDPARLSQSWDQLDVLASATEAVVTQHGRWSRSEGSA